MPMTAESNPQFVAPKASSIHSSRGDCSEPHGIPMPSEPLSATELWINQTHALFNKSIILLFRRWYWTVLRALIIPVVFILFMGYSKYLFFPYEHYGIASPNQKILSLPEAIGGLTVIYYSNSSSVSFSDMDTIMSVALHDIPSSQIQRLTSSDDVFSACPQTLRGASRCYGGVQWNGINIQQNFYNYTVRSNWGVRNVDTRGRNSDVDKFVLPLQLAIDNAILNTTAEVSSIPFTSISEEENKKKRDQTYMRVMREWLAPALYIGLIGVVYQLAGVVAEERELGLTSLLTCMETNSHARWSGYIGSFGLVYLSSWIFIGLLFARVYFKHTNAAIPIFFAIFNGAASITWSIFLGTIFRSAQLAGIISAGFSIVLAILTSVQTQVGSGADAPGSIYVCSLLFNPMSFCFFIQLLCYNESDYKSLDLVKYVNGGTTYPLVVFLAPFFQFYFYIGLTFIAERLLYGKKKTLSITMASDNAIEISRLNKTYKSFFSFKSRKQVAAVNDLSLNVSPNQIFSLLGANGSGKTTTLEMVAGIQEPTSGRIVFRPGTKLGICPQKNVLWDNLTVAEHIHLWSRIKSVPTRDLGKVTKLFIQKCGLAGKENTLSKNLSGGQKRKLQLAIMFTGGSNVCCIDEVSSGLDPVSRRVIWDILLSFRDSHTMILTTHFLDEADLLSDNIAVLSKGVLQAEGSPISLKECLGDGYKVFIDRSGSGLEESHLFSGPKAVLECIRQLEKENIAYRIVGPELEDVFLKLASKDHEGYSLENYTAITSSEDDPESDSRVQSRQVGFMMQFFALLHKRFIIFLRAPLAEIAFFVIPIIVSGACYNFLTSSHQAVTCDIGSRFSNQRYTRFRAGTAMDFPFATEHDFTTASPGYRSFVEGQASWAADPQATLNLINTTVSSGFHFLNSFRELYSYIEANYSQILPGGLSLRDNPTIAYQVDSSEGAYYAPLIMNLFTNMLLNGTQTVVTNYSPFQISWVASTGNVLQFIAYFGLSMAVAPAFFGLYPTFERLSKVRAMQYSNGLRALPLWTAYLMFDFAIILVVSGVCLGIINSTIDGLYGPGYLFLVFVLYLTTATLFSFVVSLFVKSQLAEFAVVAAYEAVFVLIYLIGYLTTQTFGHPADIERNVRILYFTIGVISPSQSLMRSLFVSFNIFGILCGTEKPITYMGNILAYGGPILYLVVQIVILFSVLIWWETGVHQMVLNLIKSFFLQQRLFLEKLFNVFVKQKNWIESTRDPLDIHEKETGFIDELEAEVQKEEEEIEQNIDKFDDGLVLQKIKKEYDEKFVVDGISFGVCRGECFALLGPNGAGKTTTFNMIRGEIQPTSGSIRITGISVAQERALARTKLGVCPQFDAMDKLEVVEVLHFYARLRGVGGKKGAVQRHVDDLIQAVDLQRFRTRLASKLSGGNKRKLSLAVSLIGNPDVLLLDEPSSGMDAFAKRIIWRALSKVAPGRSIVLTTHSMEEADALANRAGILARKMLALGTVERLRGRYGDLIHVHLVCTSAPASSVGEMNHVVSVMSTIFPGARVEDRMYQGQIKLAVPTISIVLQPSETIGLQKEREQHVTMVQVFQLLEEHKIPMGIKSYSVFPTRLEEVFLKIVGDYIEHSESSN